MCGGRPPAAGTLRLSEVAAAVIAPPPPTAVWGLEVAGGRSGCAAGREADNEDEDEDDRNEAEAGIPGSAGNRNDKPPWGEAAGAGVDWL